jgi:hypothetical protein
MPNPLLILGIILGASNMSNKTPAINTAVNALNSKGIKPSHRPIENVGSGIALPDNTTIDTPTTETPEPVIDYSSYEWQKYYGIRDGTKLRLNNPGITFVSDGHYAGYNGTKLTYDVWITEETVTVKSYVGGWLGGDTQVFYRSKSPMYYWQNRATYEPLEAVMP